MIRYLKGEEAPLEQPQSSKQAKGGKRAELKEEIAKLPEGGRPTALKAEVEGNEPLEKT